MLGIDGLNLALTLVESGMLESAVNEILAKSQVAMAVENTAVKQSIKAHVGKWSANTKERLTKISETERFQREIQLYQETIILDEVEFIQQCPLIIEQLQWHSSFYIEAKRIYEKNKHELNPLFPHYFCDLWYKSLSNAIKDAQLVELESDKEAILKDLYQRIETLKEMDNVAKEGSVQQIGRLWDMASSKLSKKAIKDLHRYAQFLASHSELNEIAKKLGRMTNNVDDPESKSKADEVPILIENMSQFATDDIVGVHENDDLNKMLPNETMFLAYPELEVIFYKHLVDKRLMNYKTQGKERALKNIKTDLANKNDQLDDKGPFVICVDASGSMAGFPEKCAKAMAYALMKIAMSDSRDCYVVLFSTEQITYELTKQNGLREAADFLSYQFNGGTDFEPAVLTALTTMKSKKYINADLVVISDFMAPNASDELIEQVADLQALRNRFHAISLSKYGNLNLLNIFDQQWHYHPSLLGRLTNKLSR